MKTAIMIAMALVLSGVAAMAFQPVMAKFDVDPGASSFSPGKQHAEQKSPTDPYKFAPGQQYDHDKAPTDPYKFSPGQISEVGKGKGPD